MRLNDEDFKDAVKIITSYCSTTTLSFNVPVNDNYSTVYPIILHNATPGLMKKLFEAGFLIGVCDKGTYLDKL